MIRQIKRGYGVCRAVAFVTYKEWAAYRTHAMVSIFVGPVYYLVQIYIWRTLYTDGGTIMGMSLDDTLAYFGIIAVIGYLTMDFADWNLQMLVHTGKFVTFMLRPMHHRFFALSQKIGHRILGFWLEFLPVYFIFIFIFKVRLVPASWFWTVLSLIFAFLMVFYTNYCIGIASFWLTKTAGLRNVFSFFVYALSGALIPLTFFPDAVQKIIFFLPFQFITYVPAKVFAGSYSLAGIEMPIPAIVGLQGFVVVITALLSEALYRLGLKRFTGVGA